MATVLPGQFYEFTRGNGGNPIGRPIARAWAILRLQRGEDVYTLKDSDARSLAKDVQKGKADWEGAHEVGYYPHYHPAGIHGRYGHIFYGEPGYRLGENRRR